MNPFKNAVDDAIAGAAKGVVQDLQQAARDVISRDTWEQVAKGLRGAAKDWWSRHGEAIKDMAIEDLRDVSRRLADGDLAGASVEVAGKMEPDAWRAYRDGTTHRLQGIAAKRAKLLEILRDLGVRSAAVIGQMLAQALAPLLDR